MAESKPCPRCGGRGKWTETTTEMGSVWDPKEKKMVPKSMKVEKQMQCSGPCGGPGTVYK